jgi:membrane protein
MKGLDTRIQAFLWPDTMPASPLGARAMVALRYAYALLRALTEGELNLRAMSLVYTTMLALVPLLAFSFSVLKGLDVHRQIEPLLLRFFAPLGVAQATELTTNVIGFVDNVSGSTIASVSILILLYSALTMAQKVESSFNFVWRVDRPRSFARRFSEYLSLMLVGPLVMSVAMGLIATVSSTTIMSTLRESQPWLAEIGGLMPYLMVVVAFSFLYVIVPNSKVHLRPAMAGGLFAGTVWATSGNLFASFVAGASRTAAIYAGFSIVIVAMIWLYLSWLILLLGAQLAYYLQNPDELRFGQRREPMSNRVKERLALGTMLLVGRDFDEPAHGWRTGSLAARMRVPRHQLEPVMADLTAAGLLTRTEEQRLMPARDPHRIAIKEILDAVRGGRRGLLEHDRNNWNATVSAFADRIEAGIDEIAGERTLADLVDEDRERQLPPP